jgi:hypothetical protein
MSSLTNLFSLPPRSGSKLCYARYVGRVGALAVSLGVGFAVASTPGIALADESTNAAASSNPPGSSNPPSANSPRSAAEQRQSSLSERRRVVQLFGGNADSPNRHFRVNRSATSARHSDNDVDSNDGGVFDGTVKHKPPSTRATTPAGQSAQSAP